MIKGWWILIIVMGLLFTGTTTLQARELSSQGKSRDCSVVVVSDPCPLPAPESEEPGQVDIEAFNSDSSVAGDEKLRVLFVPANED